jgi:hypothetical protein
MKKSFKSHRLIKKTSLISATSFKNFLLKDPLIDYLKFTNNTNKNTNNTNTTNNKSNSTNTNTINNTNNKFTDYLFEEGTLYENKVIDSIKETHKDNFIQICDSSNYYDLNNFTKTINAINKNVKIIYQGMLINYENSTYGIPDLLVLSTYINTVFPNTIDDDELFINDKPYYFVIEIKNSTVKLDSKGKYVLNSGNLVVYKGQLYVYNQALNNILEINNQKTFILDKQYKLGLVDFNKDTNYNQLISEGIDWLKQLEKNGKKWKLLPRPSHPNLYPNMKNSKDNEWRPMKNYLAEKMGELTLIWNVGIKNRQIAHKNKIYNWRNVRAVSKNMGITDGKQNIVDSILKINRTTTKIISPDKIKCNINKEKNTIEFFLDYETINKDGETWIFMIGVGFSHDKNKNFQFKCFYLDELSLESQHQLFNDFWDWVNSKTKKRFSKFYHWTKAEPIQYNKWAQTFLLPNKTFVDLYDVFKNEPIVVKGALNFSLKSIAKAMYNNKLIKTTWIDSACLSGLDALYWAIQLYKNDNKLNMELQHIMNDVIQYNQVDCQVLFEIISYLREYHI